MKKILVVDDDVDILTLVQITLTINDFAVEAISKWEDINDRIQSFDPDLILLDVSLTGADGREICKKLKQAEQTQHIPVILFSANAEFGNNIHDYQAQAFLAKPYELHDLLRTINLHLN